MRRPSRRVLSKVVGVSLATTLVADALVVGFEAPRWGPTEKAASVDGRYVAAAQTSRYDRPTVAPLHKRVTPKLLVVSPRTLPSSVIGKVRTTKGVRAVEVVDAARARLAGTRVGVLGVDPSTFRNYTPKPSAESDPLWRNVAAGDVAISFIMGKDGDIPLGSWTRIGDSDHTASIRVGAYATMGIGKVDAVVSHTTARAIGMPSANALLVSAPKTSAAKLRTRLRKPLPHGTKVTVLDSRMAAGGSGTSSRATNGEVMTAEQVDTVIKAAASQLGVPYVWGGETPSGGFDCSGLVQWAFAKAGVRMPRTADIQAFTGWRIPYKRARPGDLLTWKNDPTFDGVSHIAIYIGDGKMLVAPHTGANVRVQEVYMTNFWGAIRVNPKLAAKKAAGH